MSVSLNGGEMYVAVGVYQLVPSGFKPITPRDDRRLNGNLIPASTSTSIAYSIDLIWMVA